MSKITSLISIVKKQNYPENIKKSLNYIENNHLTLTKYSDVEDFVIDAYEQNNKVLLGIIHHFTKIRARIAKLLWQSEIFIGISVLDNLLFQIFTSNSSKDPILHLLTIIKDYGLHQPGFIVYPIHSFGILGVGLNRFFTENIPYFIDKKTGIALSPQSNSESESITFIENATKALALRFKLPYEILAHYNRSRPLKWFINNPLLLVKVNSFSDGYYENQFLITTKLRLTTSLIYLLNSLSEKNNRDRFSYFSSSTMNNFQTLDIYHYLVFQTPINNSKTFDLNCVPMNVTQPELIELSDLNVELDPSEWKGRNQLANRFRKAVQNLQTGYFKYCLGKPTNHSYYKLYNKIFTALKYFKRAHKVTSFYDESAVNLAISFEILLIDYYSPGVTNLLINRLKIVLKGKKGKNDLIESVENLFKIRGSVVHTGSTKTKIELDLCFKAFSLSFLKIMESITINMSKDENEPIKKIITNL